MYQKFKVGCSYPQIVLQKGQVEEYRIEVDLNTVSGVYLAYIFTSTFIKNHSIYLEFDSYLRPSHVLVRSSGGIENEYSDVCDIVQNDLYQVPINPDGDIDEEVRRALIKFYERTSLFVPAYRYQTV